MPIVICPGCSSRTYISPSEPSERTYKSCGQTFWTGAVSTESEVARTRAVPSQIAFNGNRPPRGAQLPEAR